MNDVEHISGREHTTQLPPSPSDLEAKTSAQIEEMFAQNGYTHINAEDAARRNADMPLTTFVRTADGKIVHMGVQGNKQYWLNVLVKDADNPTEIEQHMMNLYAGGYRDIGKAAEGTEFKKFAAQNLTGPVARTYTGVVNKVRGLFGQAA